MEALMTLDCSNYSENIVEVLKIFQQIGWYIYNPQGKVEYLPIDDDDEYDWQCDEKTESELYDIISKKDCWQRTDRYKFILLQWC